jgi:GT2 family glycosyltransferase
MADAAGARVTAVILTYNRRRELERTVKGMLALPEQPPLIVVDNGSGDGTAALLRRRYPQVRLVSAGTNLGAAARNLGVQCVTTPYVAFCDDDTCWQPGSLQRAVEMLDAAPRVACITARVMVGRRRREDPCSALMADSPLPSHNLPGRAVLGFMAGASVFRCTAFHAVGGYEPRFFLGGEEALIALDLAAAGWVMLYSPELAVQHLPSRKRDAAARRTLLLRTALWVAWLRLPWRDAAIESLQLLRAARGDGELAAVSLRALSGAGWVRQRRRVVPPQVAAWRRLLRQTAAPI